MQFLPSTWRRYGGGGDINSTRDAVLAAARPLRANGAPARMAAALYAYNHSEHRPTLQGVA
jgi:membrane-bound lytic murein transglycosylase B